MQPWGERVPRWIPILRGRTIPVSAVVIPATTGALLLIALCLYAILNSIFHFVEQGPVLIGPTEAEASPRPEPAQHVALLYAPLLAWGPLLLAVAVDYRRRGTQRTLASPTPAPATAGPQP